MESEKQLAKRVTELFAELNAANPEILAARTRAAYQPVGAQQGTFRLLFWGREIELTFPGFEAQDLQTGQPVDTFNLAMLAYYFHTSDGRPESGRWIAFTELPDGRFYTQAFQGYTGNQLAKTFGNDAEAFARAALALGGRAVEMGDHAYAFRVLPRVSLLAVCWLGDEDFPPSYRVLFDASAAHHLTTDACAIVGSTLTRKLQKRHSRRPAI